MNETWLPVIGYEGFYDISNRGRVRRVRGGMGAVAGRILSPFLTPNGYRSILLWQNNRSKHHFVHRLVAMAFLGMPREGQVANHKDANKTNNAPENLEWVAEVENHRHAARNGLYPTGARNRSAKLTAEIVLEIRRRALTESHRSIARVYGVSHGHIGKIVRRQLWSHIS